MVILGRRLSTLKWLSLGVLTIGVATVEFSSQGPPEKKEGISNHFLGCIAIMAATVTSGFAGVYFEAVLKGSRHVMSSQLFCDSHSDPNVLPHSLSSFLYFCIFSQDKLVD